MEYLVQDLKKKVNNLEYVEIKEIKDSVNELKQDLAINNKLTQQVTESHKELNKTMLSVRDTMIEMNTSMRQSNEQVKELGIKVENMNNDFNQQVSNIEKRVTEIDNKGKIDITVEGKKTVVEVAQKWIIWLLCGGGVAYIVDLLSK